MADPMVILCPGQGAQAVGMGKAWFEASPEASAVFERADGVLGDRLGKPLSTLCFEGPPEELNRTDVAQPALYVAGVASFAGICAAWGVSPNEAPLVAAAGLSLGEYTALHLAGAIGFEDGLELVALRGRAMQDAAEAAPSGMVALIGADEPQARAVCDAARADDVLVPANFNAPGQVVISGSKPACERAVGEAETLGLRATALAVAGAFHSPLMAPAAVRLGEALGATEIRDPRCPVLSNVTGEPHETERIRDRLVQQLTAPVRWASCCGWIGANMEGEPHELAPGKTLAGLMRRIDRAMKVTTHDTP